LVPKTKSADGCTTDAGFEIPIRAGKSFRSELAFPTLLDKAAGLRAARKDTGWTRIVLEQTSGRRAIKSNFPYTQY
jgi:hypothetical protein